MKMKKPSAPTSTTSSSGTAISRAQRKLTRHRPAASRRHFGGPSNSSTSSSSSSTSIEAPRGCLRYILPRSKTLTPESDKNARIPIRDGGRRSAATKDKVSVERYGKDLWSDSAGAKRAIEGDIEGVLTTPAMKDGDEENGCDNTFRDGKEKTPPVQASVSPEIQCASASSALGYMSRVGTVTPIGHPCYGAGHLLSGIIDKRKCRPRGILTVRNVNNDSDSRVRSKKFSCTDCIYDTAGDGRQSVHSSVISSVQLPCEASMQWLLSPFNERENEQRRCSSWSESEGYVTPYSSSDRSKRSKTMSISPSTSGRDCFCRNLSLASPRGLSGIKQLLDTESVDGRSLSPTGLTPIIRMITSKEDEIPFTMDCLSDGIVNFTPHSHSSSGSGTQLRTWREDRDVGNYAEVDLLAEVLHKATLSPKSLCSPWDLTTDSSVRGCIDFAKVQDVVDSKMSWISTTSWLDNSSQSQLRISWRDGLHSRMSEMDEYECCRFLSDDEEDIQEELNLGQIHPTHTIADENLLGVCKDGANSGDSILIHERQQTKPNDQKDDANSCLGKHCTAESMSFSEEDLSASSDSEWNLCYKNELFRV